MTNLECLFSVAAMKKLETRTTSVYISNTPVKIPSKMTSPGDVALSQTQEPVFEVGWDCHSPCDEGNSFSAEEHNITVDKISAMHSGYY